MATKALEAESRVVSSGNEEMDNKLGGGIPVGALTLIEGVSDAGKSVLCQQLTYGALTQSKLNVAYYTTENTVKSLLVQMNALNLNVTDYFLLDALRIYPLAIPTRNLNSEALFNRIISHIERLPKAIKVVMVDSVTNMVAHTDETGIMDFFTMCKSLCDQDRTIFTVVHSHAFDERMLIRVRSLCDAHLKLRLEEVGHQLVKMMEVSKVRNAERTTGNVVSFEVEPGIGMRIIPISRAKA